MHQQKQPIINTQTTTTPKHTYMTDNIYINKQTPTQTTTHMTQHTKQLETQHKNKRTKQNIKHP